ncbi:MAG: hypothetical protein MJK15_03020 [Colwellia sp.]|nr:hypothetical protein [Colwellia sp.]
MANTWVVQSAGGNDEMTSPTLGNLVSSKVRVVSDNVTWDTNSNTGYLWSQASTGSTTREFGLYSRPSTGQLSIFAGGTDNNNIMTPFNIVDKTVDVTVDYNANTAIVIIDGVTEFSGAIGVGTARVDGVLFRAFAREGGFNAASGTRIGNTKVYIDDVLVRDYDFDNSSHGVGVVTVDETISNDDFTGVNMATDGGPWIDLGPIVNTITLINPRLTYRAIAGNITVPASGTYIGSPTTIRARVVFSITGLPVSGLDWFTLDASPSGGNFSGSDVVIPDSNLAYKLEVDFSNDALATDESTEFWPAVHLLLDGQSLGLDLLTEGTTLTPHANTRGFNGTSYFTLTAGDGEITIMNAMQASLDRFIVILNTCVDGRALLTENETSANNFVWTPSSPLSNPLYTAIIDGVAALEGIDFHISLGCSTDARIHAVTPATFKSELIDFYADIRTRLGQANLPTIVIPVGQRTDADSQSAWEDVKQAQFEVANEDVNNYYTTHYDLPLRDAVHLADPSGIILAGRMSNLILTTLYSKGLDWRLPLITTATMLSSTETLINIEQGDGTDFTPTSGITGFAVSTDGVDFSPTITAAVRQDATTIKLTHAPLTITNYRYMYGALYDLTGVVLDNSSINLPIFNKSGDVLMVSTIDITLTGIPDGAAKTVLVDITDIDLPVILPTQTLTYSSGTASATVPLAVGSEVISIEPGNNPKTTGGADYGVTT